MKRFVLLGMLLLSSTLVGCTTTTTSMFGDDRSQFLLVDEQDLNAEAKKAYDQDLAQNKAAVNRDKAFYKRVKTISEKIIAQAPAIRPDSKNWQWEINTIDTSTVNAYCRPGGKIIVFTGLDKALKLTDDELAFVIAHEVSHALKEHTREQMSTMQVYDSASTIANVLGVDSILVKGADALYLTAVHMPFSRDMELEADKYGLELAYQAGYDPQGGLGVMQKFLDLEKIEGGNNDSGAVNGALNALLATHPASDDRYNALDETIKENHLVKKPAPVAKTATKTKTTAKTKNKKKLKK